VGEAAEEKVGGGSMKVMGGVWDMDVIMIIYGYFFMTDDF